VPVVDLGERGERPRALVARRERREDLLEQCACTREVAREIQVLRELELQPPRLLAPRRHETKREIDQARGRVRRTERTRTLCGRLELGHHLRVGAVACEREVMCAFDRIDDDSGEIRVNRSPPTRRCSGVDRGGEQRMREAHASRSIDRDEACFLGGRERCLVDHPRVRPRERGDAEQRVTRRCGQCPHTCADECAEAVRHRQRRYRVLHSLTLELSRDLDRMKRVAPRRSGNTVQHGSRERPAERVAEDAVKRRDRQRTDFDPFRFETRRLGRVGAQREDQADVLTVEAPEHELECVCGRGVEPLQVVDRDHDGGARPELADEREERGRDHAPRGWAGGVGAEQRDVEPAPLRCGQRVERLRRQSRCEVGDTTEREARLRLGRPRDENGRAASPRALDGLTPDGRLADARFTDDRERSCRSVEERVDCLQLRLAANDPRHG
jgi:hypothetical protein